MLLDRKRVMITDFTVRVKNLPEPSKFESLEKLRAKLTLHINQVVQNEPQALNMKENEIPPEQVASIHFAKKNFQIYKILIDAKELADQGKIKRAEI